MRTHPLLLLAAAAALSADSWIKSTATAGVVKNVPAGTPNRLLYKAAF